MRGLREGRRNVRGLREGRRNVRGLREVECRAGREMFPHY